MQQRRPELCVSLISEFSLGLTNCQTFHRLCDTFFLVQPTLYQIFELNDVTMMFVLEIINVKIRSNMLSKCILLEIFLNFILKVLYLSFSHLLGHNTKSRN